MKPANNGAFLFRLPKCIFQSLLQTPKCNVTAIKIDKHLTLSTRFAGSEVTVYVCSISLYSALHTCSRKQYVLLEFCSTPRVEERKPLLSALALSALHDSKPSLRQVDSFLMYANHLGTLSVFEMLQCTVF